MDGSFNKEIVNGLNTLFATHCCLGEYIHSNFRNQAAETLTLCKYRSRRFWYMTPYSVSRMRLHSYGFLACVAIVGRRKALFWDIYTSLRDYWRFSFASSFFIVSWIQYTQSFLSLKYPKAAFPISVKRDIWVCFPILDDLSCFILIPFLVS